MEGSSGGDFSRLSHSIQLPAAGNDPSNAK
jgi:hypothetical protein